MTRKILDSIFICLLLMSAVTVMVFNNKSNHAKTEVMRTLENGHELIVYEIGEPDFPFGATHCAFELKKGGKRIVFYEFDVADDGARAHSDLFETSWFADRVEITVKASEQDVIHYQLYFDGSISTY